MENTGKKWTQEEIEFFKENYEQKGAIYCSEYLKRDIKAIRLFARKNKIKGGGTREKYLEYNIYPIVKESRSVTEILLKMGLRNGGGNYKIIKNYIEKYKIDTSHFITQDEIMDKVSKFNKKPIENYLIEHNERYCGSHLKERLFKEGLKERKCEGEGCGLGEEWLGKKLVLILDHKNGNHYDCRLDNLRIMCPNCNITLATHCRGANYAEIKKEKEVVKKENYKREGLNRRKVKDRPSLEQLLSEIKEIGYVQVGKKYNVSDNAIRKWIKSYHDSDK